MYFVFFSAFRHCDTLKACMENTVAAEAQCVTNLFKVITSRVSLGNSAVVIKPFFLSHFNIDLFLK